MAIFSLQSLVVRHMMLSQDVQLLPEFKKWCLAIQKQFLNSFTELSYGSEQLQDRLFYARTFMQFSELLSPPPIDPRELMHIKLIETELWRNVYSTIWFQQGFKMNRIPCAKIRKKYARCAGCMKTAAVIHSDNRVIFGGDQGIWQLKLDDNENQMLCLYQWSTAYTLIAVHASQQMIWAVYSNGEIFGLENGVEKPCIFHCGLFCIVEAECNARWMLASSRNALSLTNLELKTSRYFGAGQDCFIVCIALSYNLFAFCLEQYKNQTQKVCVVNFDGFVLHEFSPQAPLQKLKFRIWENCFHCNDESLLLALLSRNGKLHFWSVLSAIMLPKSIDALSPKTPANASICFKNDFLVVVNALGVCNLYVLSKQEESIRLLRRFTFQQQKVNSINALRIPILTDLCNNHLLVCCGSAMYDWCIKI